MLPLIRLKVSYHTAHLGPRAHTTQVETSGAREMTNPVRFGQDFIGRVANPRDILQYYRKKKPAEKSKLGGLYHRAMALTFEPELKNNPDAPEEEEDEWIDGDDPSAATVSERLSKLRMANLVKQYLQAQNLEVLVENGLEDAVMRFVDKDDRDAIKE